MKRRYLFIIISLISSAWVISFLDNIYSVSSFKTYEKLERITEVEIGNYSFLSIDAHTVAFDTKILLESRFNVSSYELYISRLSGYHCDLQWSVFKNQARCNCNISDYFCYVFDDIYDTNLGMRRGLYDESKNSSWLKSKDVLIFHFPPGGVENFLSFGKPTLVNMAWRWDHQRDKYSKDDLMRRLQLMITKPNNHIASMSVYDREYFYYFSGINATLLEPASLYVKPYKYKPTKETFLVGPKDQIIISDKAMKTLNEKLAFYNKNISIKHLREEFGRRLFTYDELSNYKAIIMFPYASWSLIFHDIYAMGMPMFFPSRQFLTQLHFSGVCPLTQISSSAGDVSRNYTGWKSHPYNPINILQDNETMYYWLQYAMYYQWPYIYYFDTWEDLFIQLETKVNGFMNNSLNMLEFYDKRMESTFDRWKRVLHKLTYNIIDSDPLPNYEDQVYSLFGKNFPL